MSVLGLGGVVGCALVVLSMLLADPAAAQEAVTPSFADGQLVLVGEGYRPGERVEVTVRSVGASHLFTARADARGHFRVDAGLALAPLSSLEVEARDEHGLTQVTITSAPAAEAGAPLPDAPASPMPCSEDEAR